MIGGCLWQAREIVLVGGRAGRRGGTGRDRPHARRAGAGGRRRREAAPLKDVEKVLIRAVGRPDRVRQVGLAAAA